MTTTTLVRYQSTGFPLELEFGAEVGGTFKGLEMDRQRRCLIHRAKDGPVVLESVMTWWQRQQRRDWSYHQMVVNEDEEGV